MPTTRKRGTAVAVATLGVLVSSALAGCSLSKDDEPAKSEPSSAPEPTPAATQEPSTEPQESPSPTSGVSGTAAATPEAALLGAAELPQLNDSSPWTERGTTVPGQRSFGACQVFDVLSIGAMSVVQRDFRGASAGDTAGQQVAEFPDAQNTVRASKVLEAWHDKCKSQIKGKNVNVRPITDVPVTKGKAWWYLVSYTRGGEGQFHEFGVVFNRNRMTMLTMDHGGQDHNYEPGQDPMELAVKAASAKMAG